MVGFISSGSEKSGSKPAFEPITAFSIIDLSFQSTDR